MNEQDVPGPINFLLPEQAREWASRAMDRPFRLEMFDRFVHCVSACSAGSVLELGSGPGFLACYLCDHIGDVSFTLLDFSEAMHKLAADRLTAHADRVRYVTRDFKSPGWATDLGLFDCIVTNQAVHELRHKRHATGFHAHVRKLLNDRGTYLVCDHYYGDGAMSNDQLYMSVDEHQTSLTEAGFSAEVLLKKGSLVFLRAT